MKQKTPISMQGWNSYQRDQACEDLVNGWENRTSLQVLSQTERRAYYRPATDSVHMPARLRFRFPEPSLYYSTSFGD